MNRTLLFLTVLFQSVIITGQTPNSQVSGHVVDKGSAKPIGFATIELFRVNDSTIVHITTTNEGGNFFISGIMAGKYFIRAGFIGYEKAFSDPFIVEANSQFAVPRLLMIATVSNLSDIIVTGTKAQLSAFIDRKVYNVDKDIISHAGNASDLLRNVPSIEVDLDGNVALRGSGDVTILINGRPDPLMGRNRAEVLQQLPANTIERIEVITNPSARYRPDGTSGIINIVLKKNIRNGFNGTATVNAGNKDRYNNSIVLNYRPGHWNFFATYSFRKDTRPRYYTYKRSYPGYSSALDKSIFNQVIKSMAHSNAHIITAGFDYTVDSNNTLGISANLFDRRLLKKDDASYQTFSNDSTLTEDLTRLRYDPEHEKHLNGTAYYQHSFGRQDHNLRIETNFPAEFEREDNHHINMYRKPSSLLMLDNTRIDQRSHNNHFTADYSNRLSESTRIEAGYDVSYNNSNTAFYNEFFDSSQARFITNALKTNRFDYTENIHAFYSTYQKALKKIGYELGLRAEAVFTRAQLVTLDSFVSNKYLKAYPTLHLLYHLTASSELQLNYSKRVNRPDGDKLNPFPEYKDPRNLRAGNPKLLPEIIHSVEAGYKWECKAFTIVPGIYYRYKAAAFTTVIVPLNDSILLSTIENLRKDQSAGFELIVSARTKLLTTTLALIFFTIA